MLFENELVTHKSFSSLQQWAIYLMSQINKLFLFIFVKLANLDFSKQHYHGDVKSRVIVIII